jgi:hypothetical protein
VPAQQGWTSNPALTAKLAPVVRGYGFSVRPPKGWRYAGNVALASSRSLQWTSPPRKDGTRGSFSVQVVIRPAGVARKQSAEASLDRLLNAERAGRFARTPTQRGEINGVPFVRARWTRLAGTRRNARSTHGFSYVAERGSQLIWISASDVSPHYASTLKPAEAAALTLQVR